MLALLFLAQCSRDNLELVEVTRPTAATAEGLPYHSGSETDAVLADSGTAATEPMHAYDTVSVIEPPRAASNP